MPGDVDGESRIRRIERRAGFQEIRVALAHGQAHDPGRYKPPPPLAICGMGAVLPSETSSRMKGLNEATANKSCVAWTELASLWRHCRTKRGCVGPVRSRCTCSRRRSRRLRQPPNCLEIDWASSPASTRARLWPPGGSLKVLLRDGPRFASPNLFPETVFNSPTSHVAAVLGVAGPCYSLVGDDAAWVSAIRVAASWLATGSVDHALVIGAVELDPIVIDAFVTAGWLPPHEQTGYVPGEGAGALLLRRSRTGQDNLRIVQLADGFTYRQPA